MSCITSVTYKVILNGEATSSFNPGCGMRQGDPLSSYIFVLCMKKLFLIIFENVKNKGWRPVKVSKGGPGITHLFFADNLVLFGEANATQAEIMRSCMDDFCRASGQQTVCMEKQRGGLGIKGMKNLNQSLLAKSSWRLIQNEESLWSEMIRYKYIKNKPLTECFGNKGSSSCVWKGIVHGAICTLRGLQWRIGDGKEALFWTDSWVPDISPLLHYALKKLDPNQLSRRVCAFFSNEGWNYNLLGEHLPNDIVNYIISIHVSNSDSGKDKAIWGLSKDANFSVKTAFKSISAGLSTGPGNGEKSGV
ncbi:hypothetical protein ACOSQ4_026682 [Xanthoceras sorbifolium]